MVLALGRTGNPCVLRYNFNQNAVASQLAAMETQTDVYHHHPFPPPAHHPPEQYDQASSQVEYQYSQHQQPQSPIQKQPPARSKPRTFSFHSDRSRKSSQKSSHRESYQETPAQKESKRLHSKADPSVAISEAEPGKIPPLCYLPSYIAFLSHPVRKAAKLILYHAFATFSSRLFDPTPY